MRYGVSFTSPSGEKKGKSDYSTAVNSRKPQFAWNRMVEINIEIAKWVMGDDRFCKYLPDLSFSEDLFTPVNLIL